MLICFMKPLFAEEAVEREKIEKLEAQLRRKQFSLPNGIKSNTINSLCENFSIPTTDVIENIEKKTDSVIPKETE